MDKIRAGVDVEERNSPSHGGRTLHVAATKTDFFHVVGVACIHECVFVCEIGWKQPSVYRQAHGTPRSQSAPTSGSGFTTKL